MVKASSMSNETLELINWIDTLHSESKSKVLPNLMEGTKIFHMISGYVMALEDVLMHVQHS